MVLKLWDIYNGKVTHLKYINSKNESRLVKLKEPIEPDRIPLSELEKAIELMIRFVSSIKKCDDFGAVNSGKDDNVEIGSEKKLETRAEEDIEIKTEKNLEVKPEGKIKSVENVEDEQLVEVETKSEGNVEIKPEGNLETKPDVNIEPWVKVSVWPKFTIEPWVKRHVKSDSKVETKADGNEETKPEGNVETKHDVNVEIKPEGNLETKHDVNVEKYACEEGYDVEDGKREVPHEVSDKLNLLLQKGEGRIDGPQYLINKNVGKDVDTDNSSLSPSITKTDISSILRGNAATRNRFKERKKQGYSKYEKGVIKYAPEILEDIMKSSDNNVLINVSTFAEKMGKEFINVKPETLYVGIKYLLFDRDIIITILSSKEADIGTKGTKIFRLRMKNEDDRLPYSILKQRKKVYM